MFDMEQPKHAHAHERLQTDTIVWFSTVRPDGRPHAVPVWFLWEEGGTVLVFSKPDQKVRNLGANPLVMLALDDTKGGSDVVLVEGEATLLGEGEVTLAAVPAYLEKYGQEIANNGWNADTMAKDYSQAIRIKPTRLLAW